MSLQHHLGIGPRRQAGQVIANEAPTGGRKLFGLMRVLSEEHAVLGTGAVEVTAINP